MSQSQTYPHDRCASGLRWHGRCSPHLLLLRYHVHNARTESTANETVSDRSCRHPPPPHPTRHRLPVVAGCHAGLPLHRVCSHGGTVPGNPGQRPGAAACSGSGGGGCRLAAPLRLDPCCCLGGSHLSAGLQVCFFCFTQCPGWTASVLLYTSCLPCTPGSLGYCWCGRTRCPESAGRCTAGRCLDLWAR